MITIEQRAATLRVCASLYPPNKAQKMLLETADMLDALSAAYNDLLAASHEAVNEGRLTRLREHVQRIKVASSDVKIGAE